MAEKRSVIPQSCCIWNFGVVCADNLILILQDRDDICRTLDNTLGQDDGQKFIVMFNSRIHIVADYLAARGQKGNRVVGFDMLEKNMEHLRSGTVQALIAQYTDRQAADAVNTLADHILLGTPVVKKDNFTQMDILTKYNCDYYL